VAGQEGYCSEDLLLRVVGWKGYEFFPSGDWFLKLLNLQKKAVLVIDNALSHPDEDARSSGDRVIFLLPNVT